MARGRAAEALNEHVVICNVNEKVRGEVMRHFGYFMTESTGHLSEYIPWFRSSERALALYCDEPGFGGASGAYVKYCVMLDAKYRDVDYLDSESSTLGPRSVEYCSHILEAKLTDEVFRLNGNVRNDGYITNLPQGACVEAPVFVDKSGFHPVHVGALPPQLAALVQTSSMIEEMAIEAALTGNARLVMQACLHDPLSAAVLSMAEIEQMVNEMFQQNKEYLPQF